MYLVCTLAFLASCTDESAGLADSKEQRNAVEIVLVSNDKVLPMAKTSVGNLAIHFTDEASFEAFKEKLAPLSGDERAALVSRYGILTLHDLAAKADEELETIGDKASSQAALKLCIRTIRRSMKDC